jgi:predicted outer membrane protein
MQRPGHHGSDARRSGQHGSLPVAWLALPLSLVGTTFAVAAPGTDRESAAESSSDLDAMDGEFLKSAAAGSQFEITGGHIAVNRAEAAKVVRFGKRMIEDHSLEYQRVVAEAQDEDVSVPHEPDPEQKKILRTMRLFEGRRFDVPTCRSSTRITRPTARTRSWSSPRDMTDP